VNKLSAPYCTVGWQFLSWNFCYTGPRSWDPYGGHAGGRYASMHKAARELASLMVNNVKAESRSYLLKTVVYAYTPACLATHYRVASESWKKTGRYAFGILHS